MVWCEEAGRGFLSLGSLGNVLVYFSVAPWYSTMNERQKPYCFQLYERATRLIPLFIINLLGSIPPGVRNRTCQRRLNPVWGAEPRFDRSSCRRRSHWSEMGMQPLARQLALPDGPLCSLPMGWSTGWGHLGRCMQFGRCSRNLEWLCTQWAWAKTRQKCHFGADSHALCSWTRHIESSVISKVSFPSLKPAGRFKLSWQVGCSHDFVLSTGKPV